MAGKVICFDLGDTLGVGHTGPGGIVTSFAVSIRQGHSREAKGRTPSGTRAIRPPACRLYSAPRILAFFDTVLLLYSSVEGMDKTKKAFFNLAASRAATPERQCILVGENQEKRNVASSAHFVSAFHPLHVFQVLKRCRETRR